MSPQKKSRKKRPGKKSTGGQQLKTLVAALFLLGFLVVCLVLLSQVRQFYSPPSSPSPPALSGKNRPTVEEAPPLEDIRVEVESALLRSGASLDRLQFHPGEKQLLFEIEGKFPPPAILNALSRRLGHLSPEIRLEARIADQEIVIFWRDIDCVLLAFHFPAEKPSAVEKPAKKKPKLAIIMDDLGRDTGTARKLLAIDLPVTMAILPGEPDAPQVATMAHSQGREVLIHIPMEPESFPAINPGADALFLNLSAEEIRHRFRGYLGRVPFAVGGNNHMGSRFTESREGMATVLAEMKGAGLFFVDSLTSGRSVAFEEARKAGMPAAERDLFLDNVQDVKKISVEIHRLAALAERKGRALGICHPHPQTLEALRNEAGFLQNSGIEVVPVSQILIR